MSRFLISRGKLKGNKKNNIKTSLWTGSWISKLQGSYCVPPFPPTHRWSFSRDWAINEQKNWRWREKTGFYQPRWKWVSLFCFFFVLLHISGGLSQTCFNVKTITVVYIASFISDVLKFHSLTCKNAVRTITTLSISDKSFVVIG